MGKIEALFAKLLVILTSLTLCLAGTELAARYYLWHIASEKEFKYFASINQVKDRYGDDFLLNSDEGKRGLIYTPHRYLGYALTPDFESGENRHNDLGFRGEGFSPAKPDGAYRIVAVGGSTTYSVAVDDYRQSYPYQLEEHLRRSGYDQVEVINAGVGGYASYESLLNIQFRVLPLQPDLIIVYQGYNDIHTRLVYPSPKYRGDNSGYMSPFRSDTVMPPIWEYSTALRVLGIHFGITKSHSDLDWLRFSFADSNLRADFSQQWSRGTYPSGIFAQISAMQILQDNPPVHFERNLINMLAIGERHNTDIVLVTFKTSTKFDVPVVASEEYIFALAQHNDLTRRIAETYDTPIFDLQRAFPDDPGLFTDGRHMTAEGNLIRAQLIGDFVASEFLS